MGILNDKWISFVTATAPAGLSADSSQYIQLQHAYYAGVSVVMAAVRAAGETNVSEDAALDLIASIDEELDEFVAGVHHRGKEARRRRDMRN